MNRLTLRLSVGIALLVVIPLAGGLWALSGHHFSHTLEARRRAAELQNRILETALRHQMLETRCTDDTLVSTLLREIGAQPEVRAAMVLNHEGVVRRASRPDLIGEKVSRDSPTCHVCHRKDPGERSRWAVIEVDGGEVLRSVQPIENRGACRECHPPEKRMTGILILDVGLAELKAELAEDRRWMVAGTAGLAFLILAGVGLLVRRLVLARLARLGATARAIAAGNSKDRAVVAGDDTIARLAVDFNHMADAVLGLVTEVRERESRLANVMSSVDDGLVVLDRGFRVLAANHAFCRRFGSHPEALRGRSCRDATGMALPCRVAAGAPGDGCGNGRGCPSARCLATGEVQRRSFELPAQDGDPGRVEEVHASPVFDEEGRVTQVVEVWRDISERVREEARLAELERLESLGALASGFSHEVNTPLATTLTCAESIVGRIDDAARGAAPPPPLAEIRESADIIRGQVLRCRKITEQFLRFSRGIPPAAEPVDLGALAASLLALVGPTARQAGVAVRLEERAEPLPPVHANTEAVQHVLLNLLVNAIQSCDGRGGTVVVSARAGDDVRLRVRDDGRGVPPEARKHLFEPFHTSRPHGTGIGLFLSRGIMRRFGGEVRLVESEVGKGSSFEVVFARAGGDS